ncbi:hypothetical protein EVE91_15445 [Lactiplantibacillus plantarum]|nr:hypothetical protein EVE91_15445 [Lactiplantibacillus plantarum]
MQRLRHQLTIKPSTPMPLRQNQQLIQTIQTNKLIKQAWSTRLSTTLVFYVSQELLWQRVVCDLPVIGPILASKVLF